VGKCVRSVDSDKRQTWFIIYKLEHISAVNSIGTTNRYTDYTDWRLFWKTSSHLYALVYLTVHNNLSLSNINL
jgi:hypothetical protein